MNLAGLDLTAFANAFLALVTSIIMLIAVKIGRRAKPEPKPSDSMKMDGVTIISSESLNLLAAAIEGHTMEQIEHRKEAEKARQLGYRAVEMADKFKDEIEEMRGEIRRLGDVMARR